MEHVENSPQPLAGTSGLQPVPSTSGVRTIERESNQGAKNCDDPPAGPKNKAKKLSVRQLFAKGLLFKTKRRERKREDEDQSP